MHTNQYNNDQSCLYYRRYAKPSENTINVSRTLLFFIYNCNVPVDHRIMAKVNIFISTFGASVDAYVYRGYAGFSNGFSDFRPVPWFNSLIEMSGELFQSDTTCLSQKMSDLLIFWGQVLLEFSTLLINCCQNAVFLFRFATKPLLRLKILLVIVWKYRWSFSIFAPLQKLAGYF